MEQAQNFWWRGVLSLACGSGLRYVEILNLTWNDVDFANWMIAVVAKKESQHSLAWDPQSRKNRMVPMSDESVQIFADTQLEGPEGFPHLCLHDAATTCENTGTSKAGHADISTTGNYYLRVRSEDSATADTVLNEMLVDARRQLTQS